MVLGDAMGNAFRALQHDLKHDDGADLAKQGISSEKLRAFVVLEV